MTQGERVDTNKQRATIQDVLALDAKRTQGAWVAASNFGKQNRLFIREGARNYATAIATVHARIDRDANAAFIAAAPDMARIIRELVAERESIASGSAVVVDAAELAKVIAEMRLMASEGYDVTQTKLYGWIGELERLARGEVK